MSEDLLNQLETIESQLLPSDPSSDQSPPDESIQNEEYSEELNELIDTLSGITEIRDMTRDVAKDLLTKASKINNIKVLEMVTSFLSNYTSMVMATNSIINSKISLKSKRFQQKIKLNPVSETNSLSVSDMVAILKAIQPSNDAQRNERIIDAESGEIYSQQLIDDRAAADELFEKMIEDGEFDELAIVMSEVAKTDIVFPI